MRRAHILIALRRDTRGRVILWSKRINIFLACWSGAVCVGDTTAICLRAPSQTGSYLISYLFGGGGASPEGKHLFAFSGAPRGSLRKFSCGRTSYYLSIWMHNYIRTRRAFTVRSIIHACVANVSMNQNQT